MIVLSEASPRQEPSASANDLAASTEVARLCGARVYHIPQDFDECDGVENALYYLKESNPRETGVWIGYIPTIERYRELYEACLQKNIQLINTPEQHQQIMEFDHAYTRLRELTPRSVTLTSPEMLDEALSQIGLPVFVKGSIQSTKADGWRSCVALNKEELRPIVERLFRLNARSRGRVILRELVSLRHSRTSGLGFPLGREYRVFLYGGEILACGYYWEGDDPLKALSSSEEEQVFSLAIEAAKRFDEPHPGDCSELSAKEHSVGQPRLNSPRSPYLAVDVGQLTDGRWIVIEVGDAQFCGASQVSLWSLWSRLLARVAPGE
jgi:hypothetical protein